MGTNNIRHYYTGSWAQRRAALTLAVLDGHEVKFNLEEQAVDADTERHQRVDA